jgi:CheY-like chemotaxis protein
VDDSTVNLRLTKRKIQLALGDGVIVRTAIDGLEGIAAFKTILKEGNHSLLKGIFMDYHMPKCSGIDAIIEIRRIEQQNIEILKPCYIAAFTADLSDVSRSQLIDAGANEVLAKPTPTGQLEEICSNLCLS